MSAPRASTPDGFPDTPGTASPGNNELELTPRSKIKALLATVDDDSSDADIVSKPRPAERRKSSANNNDATAPNAAERDDSSSDSDAIVKKRRHAPGARSDAMEAPQDPSTIVADEDVSDAYERVRRTLMAKKPAQHASDHEASAGGKATVEEPRIVRRFLQKKKPAAKGRSREGSIDGLHYSAASRPASREGGLNVNNGEGNAGNESSDDDSTQPTEERNRFEELVKRKREEREAREAEEEAKRQARLAAMTSQSDGGIGNVEPSDADDDTDDSAADKNLTQASRPARKASKKALEEMSRETQRMSRNMQLEHQATTVKKISKQSFLDRFKPKRVPPPAPERIQGSSTVASSAPASDFEAPQAHTSPMTSPSLMPDPHGPKGKGKARDSILANPFIDEKITAAENMAESSKLDKGKGKAVVAPAKEIKPKKPVFTQRPIKIRPPKQPVRPSGYEMDWDSDLEIESPGKDKPRSKALEVLSRIPEKRASQNRSTATFRALAHLKSPGSKPTTKKGTMTQADLQLSLQARARQQAIRERAEKVQNAKDRGIVFQTAEEREKEQMEVENLLEKARKEDAELTKKERDDAKQKKGDDGEEDVLSSGDEEYQDEGIANEAEVLSNDEAGDEDDEEENSEEEEEDEVDDEDEAAAGEEVDGGTGLSLIENEAIEDDSEDPDHQQSEHAEIDEVVGGSESDAADQAATRRRPRKNVVEDDEDEDEASQIVVPASAHRSENPFAMASAGDLADEPMGLTQAFAATMADGQEAPEEDSLADIRQTTMPDPPSPGFDTLVADSQMLPPPSQALDDLQPTQSLETQGIDLHYSQSQVIRDSFEERGLAGLAAPSQMPDPTQDQGFQHESPLQTRFALPPPPSTIDTVVVAKDGPEVVPIVKKRGRLQRRADAIAVLSDVEDEDRSAASGEDTVNGPGNAFEVFKKAARKPPRDAPDFNKKDSKAKEMVEEQAEESEDEYAGLGGASDDNSDSGDDAEVQAMIDRNDVHVDEHRLAAFHANKERLDDEKAINKLYNDVQTGGLRRKRAGADLDLSDSDDALEARRRRKRQAFARMQKALLEDEKVKKIAEDPKKQAFLRAIEDRDQDEDDDDDIVDILEDTPAGTQDQDNVQAIPESQVENGATAGTNALPRANVSRKRPLEESDPDPTNRRPPAAARRTKPSHAPPTLAELRDSLSFLTEHPAAAALGLPQEPPSELPIPSDSDGESRVSKRRRTAAAESAVVDRLSLKRADSAASTGSGASGARMAFHDPRAGRDPPGFKVPSLLRRATTSFSAADEHGISHGSAGAANTRAAGKSEGVRMGGTKRSGVGYLVKREREKKVEASREERPIGKGGVKKPGKRGRQSGGFVAQLLGRSASWD